jgi:hypothetical protein
MLCLETSKATDYANWSDTKITVNVPMNAETGDVWVVVNGIESNRKNLNIDKVENSTEFCSDTCWNFPDGQRC